MADLKMKIVHRGMIEMRETRLPLGGVEIAFLLPGGRRAALINKPPEGDRNWYVFTHDRRRFHSRRSAVAEACAYAERLARAEDAARQ